MQVRVTPSGVMDKDTDVSFIGQGNYTDANNIRNRRIEGGNFGGKMPIKGNVLTQLNLDPAIYSPSIQNGIPNYTSDSKKFKIKLDATPIVNGSLNNHSGNFYLTYEYAGGGIPPLTVGGSVIYGRDVFLAVNVDIVNDTISFPSAHYLKNNDTIKLSGSSLPSPLVKGTIYYVIVVNSTTIKLSLTSGGAAINLTTTGTGGSIIPLALACIHKLQGAIEAGGASGYLTYSNEQVSGNIGTFDITASGDFYPLISNTNGIVCESILINEYIATGGSFVIIGSKQLDDDIFVFLASSAVSSGEVSVVSEIGVIYSTDNDSSFNYRTLVRSKKLGFSKYKQIECEIEKVGSQINLYFTDNLNQPRVLYLNSSAKRITNGLLNNGFGTAGKYDLQTIDIESCLVLPNFTAYITDLEVIQGSGSLTAGNKRYSGRFLTADFTSTDFLYPTNPINIFQADLNKPYKITGNLPDVITDKSVKMRVANITPGIFSYFELIAIEYKGEVEEAKIVQRFPLKESDTEITIIHNNRGQDNIQLSFGELLSITQKYTRAKSLKLFDGRLVLSNVSQQIDSNLSTWAQTITHTIKRTTIPYVGYMSNLNAAEIGFSLNEYLNPKNVNQFTSYMLNDTYRFGVQVQWKKTSKWSLPYWVDDIRIDTASSNWNDLDNRRTGAPSFSNNNLTDPNLNVYIYYVNFSNINLDYIVNGEVLRNQISAIRFVRSERIPEVIATGYFFAGAKATTNEIVPYFRTKNSFGLVDSYPISSLSKVEGDFQTINSVTSTDKSNYLFFYGPDFYYNKNGAAYQKQINDKILLQGYSSNVFYNTGKVAPGTLYYSDFQENFGQYSNTGFTSFSIDSQIYLDAGDNKVLGTDTLWSGLRTPWDQAACREVNVFKLTSSVSSTIPSTTGAYYGQIFRDMGAGSKYPASKELSTYQSTGHLYNLKTTDTGSISMDVYGGDVFNQKTYMLLRMGQPSGTVAGGGGFAIGIYSQNVLNTQMYYYTEWDNTDTGAGYSFPQYLDKQYSGFYINSTSLLSILNIVANSSFITVSSVSDLEVGQPVTINGSLLDVTSVDRNGQVLFVSRIISNTVELKDSNGTVIFWSAVTSTSTTLLIGVTSTINASTVGSGLFAFVQQKLSLSNNNTYSRSYDFRDRTILEKAYNPNDTFDGNKPATIVWSGKKIMGSLKDSYRVFLPGSYSDLDLTLGEITHHEIINNNFYTFQEKSFQRQYFRDPSLVNSDEGSDVLIGSGSILSARGQEISSFGTNKKWSIVKGKTSNGKEVVYWFNDRFRRIIRFGEDGTRVISERGMNSFVQNYARYNTNDFEPLRGLGLNVIWNDKYSEVIFTFKFNLAGSTKAFSLVYGEHENGFLCKRADSYDPIYKTSPSVNSHQNIVLPYNNTFFSVNPSTPNQIYFDDFGSEATFFEVACDTNIELVMNQDSSLSKNFEALQIASDEKPFACSFITKNHSSSLTQSDFELREDLFYSAIKNHELTPGVNNADTSHLWGRWIKIKVNMKTSTLAQKLINLIVKFRPMPRLYNQ